MKRSTAAKRIKTHLRDYRKRLGKNLASLLGEYHDRTNQNCPLCAACGETFYYARECNLCLDWELFGAENRTQGCCYFIARVNGNSRETALALIAKLEAELDRWAAEEGDHD